MIQHTYPGVYIVEIETAPQPIPGVPTSVSQFIGREAISAVGGLLDGMPPEWTDGNAHDPGIALLEFAAWLGESVLYRNGNAPEAAKHAARRLALASLCVASGSPVDRTRYYPGVVHDKGKPITDADGNTCLKIVRSDRRDPIASYRFLLCIEGVGVAGFSEVQGLHQGFLDTLFRRVRKLLGLRKVSNITLKRGIVADRRLTDWYRNLDSGEVAQRDVVIRQIEPRVEFRLVKVSITKIEAPALNGSANDVAIESLQLACEGICVHSPA